MKTTEYVFNGQTYVCRIVLSNEGEELIIGSTSLLDAIQPGDFEDENEGFANEDAEKIYDEIFFFTDAETLALPDEQLIEKLAANGQIATQYCDLSGQPTMDIRYNPNGSAFAIEGITSPDGRIFGKMGHSERKGDNLYKNVEGNKDNGMFRSAVLYYQV